MRYRANTWWPTLIYFFLVLGCSTGNAPPADSNQGTASPAAHPIQQDPVSGEEEAGPLTFMDVAASAGLHFRHYSPLTDERHVHLFLGSGIGWLDIDRDGWADLYCCQGAAYQLGKGDGPRAFEESPADVLFSNQGSGSFLDVTRQAGLWNTGYSMAVAAADFDNDGFVDLCITGHGENFLLRNNGDGCFRRVPLPAEKQPGRLSASCAWGDIDADGNLDLFITNYAKLGPKNYPTCRHTAGGITIPISCHPANLEAMHDLLYRNTGNGDFEDVSLEAGIAQGAPQPGLGVIAADLDADGDVDFYVANDTTPNQLWENQGNGSFLDRGTDSGTSRNRHGATEAGMGVVAGEITGTGRIDLFVTNYYGETNTLYRNEGGLLFADITDEMGLGAPSRLRLGFGTSLADFDNDGWLDLIVANGHVQDRLQEIRRDEPFAQLPLLFHHDRSRRFKEVSRGAGEYFRRPHVARSTAVADYDHDGDLDVAVNCLHDEAALLENTSDNPGNWLRLELIGRESNRGGIGATLRLDLGERAIVRCVHAGTGYLSSDETTMLIGLGAVDEVRRLTIAWPGGRRESWSTLRGCEKIGTGTSQALEDSEDNAALLGASPISSEPLRANRLWRLVEGTGKDADSAQ